ncbi:hypothetical protein CKK33_11480 [Mucilaginibacter sp. MD40]|uniref:hypothetical protein n=1 Tax=Mucilaginibacter sp. MD40 TaxID=2029590 RepID=UPI000BAC7FED|nr:hypothetical protein [Mucilaginibacter sp. MD40]PAW94082.1 hypothetical protein CKK33_11480 [Mucilaginibacter sp. MD40]
MGYNNSRFGNGGYQSNNGYGRSNYGNNGYNNNRQQARKKSGAKHKKSDKNGNPVTTGWSKTRGAGFVKFLCVFTKNTDQHSSQSGRIWANVMVVVQKPMTPDVRTSGLMDLSTGKVVVQSMGIVINPQAPNGGFTGQYGRKK